PLFFLSGAPIGDDAWRVEDDVFLDRIVRELPGTLSLHWGGRDYLVALPVDASLPAFLVLEGLADAPEGDVVLVLRRKPGVLALFRPVTTYHAAVQVVQPDSYLPGGSRSDRGAD
ncbi:MAG TPA: hypothetical protein VFJ81_09945, partial [Gemmatimonadales bacterium]|nr:hypothetical protein [Gemmatimonadales bacterium]